MLPQSSDSSIPVKTLARILGLSLSPQLSRPHLSAWCGHLPFASFLINQVKPNLIVELGTHWGDSYFCFCQNVKAGNLSTICYAVDTWQGEEHAGKYDESVFKWVNEYNTDNYAHFSYLLRKTFDDAVHQFADETIDILHIDGLHTYEAVKNDYETWLPKVKEGGVILFHDICCRHNDFGVWKLWRELKLKNNYTLSLNHSYGLGVLIKSDTPPTNSFLLELTKNENEVHWQCFYATLGNKILEQAKSHALITHRDGLIEELRDILAKRDGSISESQNSLVQRDKSIAELQNTLGQRVKSIDELQNTLAQRDESINQLNEKLVQYEHLFNELKKTLVERDEIIKKLNDDIKLSLDKIARIQKSISWKATAPIRTLQRAFIK